MVLKSADTSDSEQSMWSLARQCEEEIEWFGAHPQYSTHKTHWGIQALVSMTSKIFLQSACSVIPDLHKDIRAKKKVVASKLKVLPHIGDVGEAVLVVTDRAREILEARVRSGRLAQELASHYWEMLRQKVDASSVLGHKFANNGLPEFGMEHFSAKHPYFDHWLKSSAGFLDKVRGVMSRGIVKAMHDAVVEIRGTDPGDLQGFSDLVDCPEAESTIRSAVLAQRFPLSWDVALDQKPALLHFLKEIDESIPKVIVRMAIQICVYEPIYGLRSLMRGVDHTSLLHKLQQLMNVSEWRTQRVALERERDIYQALLENEPCVGIVSPPPDPISRKAGEDQLRIGSEVTLIGFESLKRM